ncbi:FAXC protein, partial [Acromyrmex heyeri]
MTMATETENNGPESKEIKDVKEMKEALKDDAPPDNKQEEKDAAAKKDEAAGKKDDDAAAAAAAAAAAGAATAPAKASTVHHPDYEKDVVYLYQFPRTPLLPSLSPYGLKVETWLRLNGIKYEKVRTLLEKHIPPASKSHLLGKNSKKSTLKRYKSDEDTRQKNGDETIGH